MQSGICPSTVNESHVKLINPFDWISYVVTAQPDDNDDFVIAIDEAEAVNVRVQCWLAIFPRDASNNAHAHNNIRRTTIIVSFFFYLCLFVFFCNYSYDVVVMSINENVMKETRASSAANTNYITNPVDRRR